MEERPATASEVADFLGVTPAALAQLRYTGKGPRFIKISGRGVRYRWSDVREWLDSQTFARTGGVK